MRQNNNKKKKQFIRLEKKLETKHYKILIGLVIFYLVYSYFAVDTIGHDSRYIFYIILLPIIIGSLILGYYRRQFLINRLTISKGIFLKSFLIIFYLIQGILFSFLSFGQIARIGWDYCQYRAVKQNPYETIFCDIAEFNSRRRSQTVNFRFHNNYESFYVDYATLEKYEKNKNDYVVKIVARKGIWNYYSVKDWSIEKRE